MPERSPARFARLSLRQLNRLRYIAACGPVFRMGDDEDLERLQLVRPFNGMPSVVEVTAQAERAAASDESFFDRLAGAAATLLDACKTALAEFSKTEWCRQGYGCDECEGCRRYQVLAQTVTNIETEDGRPPSLAEQPAPCR